jgi:hypothetical protein
LLAFHAVMFAALKCECRFTTFVLEEAREGV